MPSETSGRPTAGAGKWPLTSAIPITNLHEAWVLGNGDLAGSWPIHVRSARTGRIMTLDERPKFWLDGRGADKPTWQPDRKAPPPQRTPDGKAGPYWLSPDVAHVGSFAYVPYLVTGDFYYLEEACFWGNYVLLASGPRRGKTARASCPTRSAATPGA